MFKDFVKWFGRQLMHMILWVYVLSIPLQGKNLYDHARSILVENRVVSLLGDHVVDAYQQLCDRLRLSILDKTHRENSAD